MHVLIVPCVTEPQMPNNSLTRYFSDVVTVAFDYSGMRPAFPERVFKVFEVANHGAIVSKNVAIRNISIELVDEELFQVTMCFAPEKAARFTVFFEIGKHRIAGPQIVVLSLRKYQYLENFYLKSID